MIQSFLQYLGEEKYQKLVNFILRYIADLGIPKKRGCFIEFRKGMINVSPIGRNCSYEERLEFEQYDHVHHVRRNMVTALEKEFPEYKLKYSIGGQISMDIFPMGWDKTYCLQHIAHENFKEIHFFGDKTDLVIRPCLNFNINILIIFNARVETIMKYSITPWLKDIP